jgi:hypothetical protein
LLQLIHEQAFNKKSHVLLSSTPTLSNHITTPIATKYHTILSQLYNNDSTVNNNNNNNNVNNNSTVQIKVLTKLPSYGSWYFRFGRPTPSLLRQIMLSSFLPEEYHAITHVNNSNTQIDNKTTNNPTSQSQVDIESYHETTIRTYCCCPPLLEQVTIEITNELNQCSSQQSSVHHLDEINNTINITMVNKWNVDNESEVF